MNNKTQQRFDKSIADAIAATRAANERNPRRNVKPAAVVAAKCLRPKGRLYLCKLTGATVWEPAATQSAKGVNDNG